MRTLWFTGALLTLQATISVASSQARPSFAGVWKNVPEAQSSARLPSEQVGSVGRGVPKLTITQNGNTLTLSNGGLSGTYRLDGSETTNYIRVNSRPVPMKARARWEGNKLVITSQMTVDGTTIEKVRTLSLDPDGELVLEALITGTGRAVRSRSQYRKQAGEIISWLSPVQDHRL